MATARGLKLGSTALKRLFVSQHCRCAGCFAVFEPGSGPQVDHCWPLGAGGPDTYANLQLLCVSCHALKTETERELLFRGADATMVALRQRMPSVLRATCAAFDTRAHRAMTDELLRLFWQAEQHGDNGDAHASTEAPRRHVTSWAAAKVASLQFLRLPAQRAVAAATAAVPASARVCSHCSTVYSAYFIHSCCPKPS